MPGIGGALPPLQGFLASGIDPARRSAVALNELGLAVDVVRDFNASGSAESTTGSISAGSNVLTLASAIDFKNGQGISIANAGPLPTISAPTAATATAEGTTGSTTIGYAVAALDGKGGITASFAFSVTNANATLSSTNYVALSVTAVTNAVGYAWYRTSTNGTSPTTTGFIGVTSGTSLNDTGLAVITPPIGVPASAPSSALGDLLVTSITAGAGTTSLTLANAATTTVSGATVNHDDTAALNAFFAYLDANNANGTIPPGTYLCSGTITSIGKFGRLIGSGTPKTGGASGSGTQIVLLSGINATLFSITGNSSTGGYQLFIQGILFTTQNKSNTTSNLVELYNINWSLFVDIYVGQSGISGLSLSNCDTNTFINCDFSWNTNYNLYLIGSSGTNNHNTFISCRCNQAGGVGIYDLDGIHNVFIDMDVEANAAGAVVFDNAQNDIFTGLWAERNGAVSGVNAPIYFANGAANNIIENSHLLSNTANAAEFFALYAPGTGNIVKGTWFGNDGTTMSAINPGSVYLTFKDNVNYNPVGHIASPSIPTSGTAYTNSFGFSCRVFIYGGTVTVIAINGTATGITSGMVELANGETITLTYTAAPTWTWFGL